MKEGSTQKYVRKISREGGKKERKRLMLLCRSIKKKEAAQNAVQKTKTGMCPKKDYELIFDAYAQERGDLSLNRLSRLSFELGEKREVFCS